MSTRQAMMIAEALAPHEVKALRILAGTAGAFEPAGSMPGLAQPMINRLLEIGLAEQGIANEFRGTVGYRLNSLGSAVYSSLQNRRQRQPRLKMMEPTIKTVDVRTVKPLGNNSPIRCAFGAGLSTTGTDKMTGSFRIVKTHAISVDCLNPKCGKPIRFEFEPAGEKVEWSDIPDKVTLRCDACGISGEYHPKHTRAVSRWGGTDLSSC